jgi:hypothetical protein
LQRNERERERDILVLLDAHLIAKGALPEEINPSPSLVMIATALTFLG